MRSYTVASVCLIFIVAKRQCAEEGPHADSRNSVELVLTDWWAEGMTLLALDTRALLQAGQRLGAPAQLHAVVQPHAGTGPRLPCPVSTRRFQDMSAHRSGSPGSLTSVLAAANRLRLP